MTDASPQVLRSDARENRDRVLEAARELFSESGLGVTMRQIARRAEVGPATLYRRFPTKDALVLEAFLHEADACRRIVLDAAEDPDAWRGFCRVIEQITVLNAQNQGFTEAFLSEFPGVLDVAAHRSELLRTMSGIAARAMKAGDLRPDFVLQDLVLVLLAGRGIAAVSAHDRTAAAKRFAALAIEGLRAAASNGTLPRGPRLTAGRVGHGAQRPHDLIPASP
jgi:AcrR family transcriptional regulator